MAIQGNKPNEAREAERFGLTTDQWRRTKAQITSYLDLVLDGEAWAQTGAEAADVIAEILQQGTVS